MLEFIKIIYLLAVPLLLLLVWKGGLHSKINSRRVLAVINLLLIGNSVFVCRQLLAFYYLTREWNIEFKPTGTDYNLLIRMLLLIFLPVFSLLGRVRKNIWYTMLVWFVVYSIYPVQTWSFSQLPYKIITCISLFSTVYALLWLLKQLPYQSRGR